MNATTRLHSEVGLSRIYQTPHRRWSHVAEALITEIGKRHPEVAAQQFVHEIDGQSKKEDRILKMVVKHVCAPGPADIRVLEDYVGCRLQAEIARFYEQFAECVLLLRYPMRIFSPSGIVECEKMIRDAERFARCLVPDEVTALRFVQIEQFASTFALRKFKDGAWRVIICGDETTEDLQKLTDEQCFASYVETFDEWLERLLETDAYPLDNTSNHFFRPPMAERV